MQTSSFYLLLLTLRPFTASTRCSRTTATLSSRSESRRNRVCRSQLTSLLHSYQSGIGTGSYQSPWTPSGFVRSLKTLLDLGIAWNLPDHVQDGYRFLMDHYNQGDRIYLFGFSRGAFTARALAGMLQQVSLPSSATISELKRARRSDYFVQATRRVLD